MLSIITYIITYIIIIPYTITAVRAISILHSCGLTLQAIPDPVACLATNQLIHVHPNHTREVWITHLCVLFHTALVTSWDGLILITGIVAYFSVMYMFN